jgi:Rad3-related DNA helicase
MFESTFRDYKIYIDLKSDCLKILCLNPSVVFKPIAEITHSIILASYTLSPLEMVSAELGVEYKYILTASHVIQSNQVQAFVIPNYNHTSITSSYNEFV